MKREKMVGSPTSVSYGALINRTLAEDVPLDFSMAGWLVESSHAKEALEAIKKTHRVNYLEAFDASSNLIHPLKYRQNLQGALVQVHFRLTHWAFAERMGVAATDTFVSDIVSMQVLAPPSIPKPPSTPKRKFRKTDPLTPDITPKKFRNFASPSSKFRSGLMLLTNLFLAEVSK
jgi:hypothetical protein